MTIGIDPGITGAIAVYNADGYYSEDMPVMDKGAKGRRQINPLGIKNLLMMMGKQDVYLEMVHAMPVNGSQANFSMGDSFGSIRATVLTLGFPLVLVPPRTWKKYYHLTAKKEHARARAIELFPEEDFHFKRDVDRAEALLIAYYGAKQ
jgi:crossover junction endodeoxyribonuclease RuvC